MENSGHDGASPSDGLTFFLSGDVMLGRGIDQILPHPVDPHLFERHVASAATYVQLAEMPLESASRHR
jgi:poly-gamma-glutamate capsule biosynthesis protein CapA/YwtB (metallophosphatase superfamily)